MSKNARRQSSDRIRAQSLIPRDRRETSHPCPQCGGVQSEPSTKEGYAVKVCFFCHGTGLVTTKLVKLHKRWVRIRGHYRNRGLCDAQGLG